MTDVFESEYRKIVRAIKHRESLRARIEDYVREQAKGTVLKPDSEFEHWQPTRQPPIDIPILAGEVVYQIRSTLDHLFFELVKLRKGPGAPPSNWERLAQFPLYTEAPSNTGSPVARKDFPGEAAQWISDKAYTFVERVQPYYHGKPEGERLFHLVNLSNIDKHRRLAVVTQRADVEDTTQLFGGTAITIRPDFKPGAELVPLSEPPEIAGAPMHVERKITAVVAFDEPELGYTEGTRVQDVIDGIWDVGNWVASHLGALLEET